MADHDLISVLRDMEKDRKMLKQILVAMMLGSLWLLGSDMHLWKPFIIF